MLAVACRCVCSVCVELNSAVAAVPYNTTARLYKVPDLDDGIKEYSMEYVLQIHTEPVSAQLSHFYEVCTLKCALLGPVKRQT